MDNPLTLQEAKDQVAKKYGFESWFHVISKRLYRLEQVDELINEAMNLHARSKWDESARAVLMAMNGEVDEEDIPEFKP